MIFHKPAGSSPPVGSGRLVPPSLAGLPTTENPPKKGSHEIRRGPLAARRVCCPRPARRRHPHYYIK